MSSLRHLVFLLLVAAGVSGAIPAAAAEPTPEELQQAGVHFQAGAEYYTVGDYSKAIVEFLKAYNVVPNALFLYNISLSYAKLDNLEDAYAAALKAQRGTGLDQQTATRNDARIAAFESVLRARKVAPKLRSEVSTEVAETTASSKDGIGALGWTGIGLLAVGGGLEIGALVMANSLSSRITDYEIAAREGDRAAYDGIRSEIADSQRVGRILLYSGAGTMTVGALLLIIDLATGSSETNASATLIPLPDGGAAGVFSYTF